MRLRSKLSPAVAACLMLGIAVTAAAQEPTGIISGTITDTSGALVPNANITITNKATGAARTSTANAEGLYSALAIARQCGARGQPGFRTVGAAKWWPGAPPPSISPLARSAQEVVTVEAPRRNRLRQPHRARASSSARRFRTCR